MTRETFGPLDLAASGNLEPLRSTLVRLHLRHCFLQIKVFLSKRRHSYPASEQEWVLYPKRIYFVTQKVLRFRRDYHGYVVALKPGIRLDLVFTRKALNDLIKDLHAQFRTDDLAPSEIHHDFCLVALFNEAVDIPDLELKVVLIDLRSDLYFLKINSLLLSMFLVELVFVFAKIKDLAYRRNSRRRHLNKVKFPLLGNMKGFADCHYAKLAAIAVNYPDLFGPDLLIHSDIFANVPVTDVFTS